MIQGLTTPSEINSHVFQLCNKIGGVEEPIFVNVIPRKDSIVDDCYIDVENQINDFGGGIQYGWILWTWEGFYAEATFHAVWKNHDGQLLDVSKKEDGETKIAFAPDNHRKFSNLRIPSIKISLSHDVRVKEWIRLTDEFEKHFAILTLKTGFGKEVSLSGEAERLHIKAESLFNKILADFLVDIKK